ncbi:MAG: hypothetical protein AB7L17_19285 [Ilumatobacteraceae bacterium]|jgi:hypothetical protein
MSLSLKPGARLYSAVCTTELIAVKAPSDPVELTIGGVEPLSSAAERDGSGTIAEGHGGGTAMGKRYVDDAETVELLCTKAGDGVPALNGEVLHLKEAKPLPASD